MNVYRTHGQTNHDALLTQVLEPEHASQLPSHINLPPNVPICENHSFTTDFAHGCVREEQFDYKWILPMQSRGAVPGGFSLKFKRVDPPENQAKREEGREKKEEGRKKKEDRAECMGT